MVLSAIGSVAAVSNDMPSGMRQARPQSVTAYSA
jgi:hypothetical protein